MYLHNNYFRDTSAMINTTLHIQVGLKHGNLIKLIGLLLPCASILLCTVVHHKIIVFTETLFQRQIGGVPDAFGVGK